MDIIEQICGNFPVGFTKQDISSNPNFVFTNDPNFSARQIYDIEGNTITVNSFLECEHYVSGGWDFTPIRNNELYFQDLLIYFVLFSILVTFLKPKILEYFKN